jgi:hypothetical protein
MRAGRSLIQPHAAIGSARKPRTLAPSMPSARAVRAALCHRVPSRRERICTQPAAFVERRSNDTSAPRPTSSPARSVFDDEFRPAGTWQPSFSEASPPFADPPDPPEPPLPLAPLAPLLPAGPSASQGALQQGVDRCRALTATSVSRASFGLAGRALASGSSLRSRSCVKPPNSAGRPVPSCAEATPIRGPREHTPGERQGYAISLTSLSTPYRFALAFDALPTTLRSALATRLASRLGALLTFLDA